MSYDEYKILLEEVKRLKKCLNVLEIKININQCRNSVAVVAGFKNWKDVIKSVKQG